MRNYIRFSAIAIAIAATKIAVSAYAQDGFDTPDTNLESRMFDIYKKYNSEPIADSEWMRLLGDRRAEAYRIQTGDTLWDISETFFGDGKYWPKLWSENAKIENPHDILPRRQIQFLAGTAAEAPVFNVVAENEPLPTAPTYVAPDVQDQEVIDPDEPRVVGGKPVIPKAVRQSAPLLPNLPESFKVEARLNPPGFDESGLDASMLRSRGTAAAQQLLPFFVMETAPVSVGVVHEVEQSDTFAGELQTIFIQMNRPATEGEELSVFFDNGKLKNAHISKGRILEVGGRIRVKELVDEAKQVYRAEVLDSLNPVRVQSIVSEMPLPSGNFLIDKPAADIQATVVGAEYDRNRKVVGLGSVVYLRSGTEPLTEGEILTVQSARKTRKPGTKLPNIKEAVAVLKVAKVDGELASAILINSISEVRPGDVTGGPLPTFDTNNVRNLETQEISAGTP